MSPFLCLEQILVTLSALQAVFLGCLLRLCTNRIKFRLDKLDFKMFQQNVFTVGVIKFANMAGYKVAVKLHSQKWPMDIDDHIEYSF